MRRGLIAIVVVCACGVASAKPLALEPTSSRGNFFAGREATLGVVMCGGGPAAGRLAWTLTAFGRTLAGGTSNVRHDGGPATITEVAVAIPEVKEGVVVEAAFTAIFVDAAGTRLASHTQPVRIFPANPFVDQTRWLESLNLVLIDPTGDTERVLIAAGVPFTLAQSDADIASAQPRIIMLGEGGSWLDRPDLPALATRWAASGVPVLCLAPQDGTLPLSGMADVEGEAVATRFALERAGAVADLDPRLDNADWVAEGRTITTRVAVVGEGDRAVIRLAAAAEIPGGWPWLQLDYADPAAATTAPLVMCGYGIIAHWDETPAARYLLAAILHRLTADRSADASDLLPTTALPEKPR